MLRFEPLFYTSPALMRTHSGGINDPLFHVRIFHQGVEHHFLHFIIYTYSLGRERYRAVSAHLNHAIHRTSECLRKTRYVTSILSN
ncbi:hypothetical protein HCUR_00781 [Holospora curviuscula]|uniref:Uncharacterized protein n=1 Tax=Holospora curviuscula TaxID=1082868 RepID=A0A2S5R8V6_9PROT|nr:hypothetical protein HCUR_00781 [Holospora curviuscula]